MRGSCPPCTYFSSTALPLHTTAAGVVSTALPRCQTRTAFSSFVMRPCQYSPRTLICLPMWSSGFFKSGSASSSMPGFLFFDVDDGTAFFFPMATECRLCHEQTATSRPPPRSAQAQRLPGCAALYLVSKYQVRRFFRFRCDLKQTAEYVEVRSGERQQL